MVLSMLSQGNNTIVAKGSMLGTNWYPGPMEFTDVFEANTEYYLRVTPQHTGTVIYGDIMAMSGEAVILIVIEKDASREISETKRIY
jgi:hypothetical protein